MYSAYIGFFIDRQCTNKVYSTVVYKTKHVVNENKEGANSRATNKDNELLSIFFCVVVVIVDHLPSAVLKMW